jgi:transcriptional regulator with XRE-family HTH domain
MNNYADAIKALRDRLGLNQRTFAELIGVAQKTLSAWETPNLEKRAIPSPEMLERIEKKFNVRFEIHIINQDS